MYTNNKKKMMVSFDSVAPEVPDLIEKIFKGRQRGPEPKQTY